MLRYGLSTTDSDRGFIASALLWLNLNHDLLPNHVHQLEAESTTEERERIENYEMCGPQINLPSFVFSTAPSLLAFAYARLHAELPFVLVLNAHTGQLLL